MLILTSPIGDTRPTGAANATHKVWAGAGAFNLSKRPSKHTSPTFFEPGSPEEQGVSKGCAEGGGGHLVPGPQALLLGYAVHAVEHVLVLPAIDCHAGPRGFQGEHGHRGGDACSRSRNRLGSNILIQESIGSGTEEINFRMDSERKSGGFGEGSRGLESFADTQDGLERVRFSFTVPTILCGNTPATIGRLEGASPLCLLFLASEQLSLFGLPQGEIPRSQYETASDELNPPG